MMKLLFVHDATFKYDKDGKYYGTSVNPNTMSRYKYLSDDITVFIRTYPFDKNENREKYTLITDEFHVVGMKNYMSVKGMLFERRKVKATLKKLIEENDIVFARFSGETGKMAVRLCRKLNKPYVVECVGCYWDSFSNYGWKGKIIAPYMYLSTRHLIKGAPYVVYVTNKFLQKRYPSHGKSIAASNVELRPMTADCLQKRLEKIKTKKEDEPIVLGTAAAIDVPYKGQAYVIEAISKLNKQGYNYEYQLIGTGDKTRLEKIAKEFGVLNKVKFVGVLKQDKVFDWMDKLDIYIQPSDQEGLPRALIESMSRACPAIGSTTAGIPELLHKEAIFTRKKVDELVEVLKIMTDKERQVKHAKRNFKEALGYQRDIIYKRRNDFYDMIIEEKGLKRN